MRVRWQQTAVTDISTEIDFIARDDPAAADRVAEKIERSVERLAAHPAMGCAGRVPGTRELVIPGTPYIVPYRVRRGAVEVLRVFHAARLWPTEID